MSHLFPHNIYFVFSQRSSALSVPEVFVKNEKQKLCSDCNQLSLFHLFSHAHRSVHAVIFVLMDAMAALDG